MSRPRRRFRGPHDRLSLPSDEHTELVCFVRDLANDLGLTANRPLMSVLVGVFLTGMSCGMGATKERDQ